MAVKTVHVDIATDPTATYDIGIRSEGSTADPSGSYLKTNVQGPHVQFDNVPDGNYEGVVRRSNEVTGAKGSWFTVIGRDELCPDLVSVTITDIGDTSGKIVVVLPSGVTAWEWKKEGGVWNAATTSEVTVPGLTAETNTTVYVRPVAGALVKGKIVKATITTTGPGTDKTAIQKVQENCFNTYHTNWTIRFTILNGLIPVGEKYQIKLTTVIIAEHEVTADDTLETVIHSLFNQAIGNPGTIVVSGTSASFDYETYNQTTVDGIFYPCGTKDESTQYTFITA